ncbi:MAG: hypothetical protein VX833_06410 [Actinomycetota bacterium]|nr:hypothetical protein [Actinomycetota bacterium]
MTNQYLVGHLEVDFHGLAVATEFDVFVDWFAMSSRGLCSK